MGFTLLLAHIWGPILLAVGLGMFISRAYYTKLYRNLEQDALAVFTLGMLAMAIGILQVSLHSSWATLPEIVITLLSWGILLKGIVLIVWPDFVDKTGNWWAKYKLIPVAGIGCLALAAYLMWIAYIA